MQPHRTGRRHDLDWLRVAACYLLLLFHVAMVFNPAPFYHVRNGEVSFAFLVLCGFISLWHMPLFFLLAGWSAFASLRLRGVGTFVRERGHKLALPLLVGCVLLVPPIKYLELRSGLDLYHRGLRVSPELQESFRSVVPAGLPEMAPFDESFLEFLPSFFTQLDRFSWSHLWFLAYLLAFTLAYLPLFVLLLRRTQRRLRAPALWVYAPILPLAAIQLGLRERFPGPYNLYDDWASVAFYSTFLFAGFLLARHPELEDVVVRERRRAFAIALGAMAVLLGAVLGIVPGTSILLAGSAVAGWCFVVALLGTARVHWARRTRGLAYLTDSAFPVYVLHQLVIVVLGYGTVELPLGIVPKFLLLLAGSTLLTVGIYHFGVRPFAGPRFLLGLRPRQHASATTSSSRGPVSVLQEPA